MTNPIDALPDGEPVDPRTDPRLNDVAFIATDEGQALLAAAQAADKEARRIRKNETERLRRERIKREAEESGVPPLPPAPKGLAIEQPTSEPAPEPAKPARPNRSASRVEKPKVTNKPLTLDGTVVIKGVTYRAIRHRDGAIAEHQTDNYIWRCPTCLRRLRDASCVGPKGGAAHKAVKAPEGYRAADRIVK